MYLEHQEPAVSAFREGYYQLTDTENLRLVKLIFCYEISCDEL